MIGKAFGSYVVTAPLGKGAMGEVYEARHHVLGRRVAIKVLRVEHKDGELVERFFNEARAASAVEHGGIVEVIDFGRSEEGQPYLVMELLDGESLGVRLRRVGALGVEVSSRIARQVASALGAAHARGIVHRDLKPDNIFLVRDPEVQGGERAKVVDFGIAKLADPELRGAVATHQGALVGTPAYMAPEQCRGSVEVDRRADLYALGCILFEMLAGRPPFEHLGLGDLLAAHMFEPPPALHDLVPSAPATLAVVVDRLLCKRPEERFSSAAELLVALDGGEVARAAPSRAVQPGALLATLAPGTGDTLQAIGASESATFPTTTLSGAAAEETEVTPPRSRRGVAILAGAVAVAALGFGGYLVLREDRPARESAPANEVSLAPVQQAIDAASWADAITAADTYLATRPADVEAKRLRARAVAEQASQGVYKQIRNAIIAGDTEAAVAGFRSLSGSSMYYTLTSSLFQSHRAQVLEAKRGAAVAAAKAKDCTKVRALDAEVRRWFPDTDPLDGMEACDEGAPQVMTAEAPMGPPLPPFPADGIPKVVVDLVFQSNIERFRACHTRAQVRSPSLAGGQLLLHVTVGSGGSTSAAVLEDPIGDAELVKCVERVAATMIFPSPDSGGVVEVNYPINFGAAK